MNVLCPKCRRSIPTFKDDPVLKCGHCNLVIDRLNVGLSPGLTSVPLVPDLRGETIGQYQIQDLVGLGFTGVVYRARNNADGQTVAFKVLHFDLLRKSDFLTRFRQEAGALCGLDHPKLAKILKYGRKDDLYFVISEFIEGVTLTHYLSSFQLGLDEIRSIIAQIGAVLAYAHSRGVVHRNLKPDNVIMGKGAVKVLDFGLAHLASGDARATTIPRPGAAGGNYNYLSPEQRTGTGPVDKRSDIYSLGAIFYEMLTGRPPLGAFPPPSSVKKGLDKKYDRLVLRCLDQDPEQRWDKAEDFLAELERVAPERPTGSRTPLRLILLLMAGLSLAVYLWPRWPDLWAQLHGTLPPNNIIIRIKQVVQPPELSGRGKSLDNTIPPFASDLAQDPGSKAERKTEAEGTGTERPGLVVRTGPSLDSQVLGRLSSTAEFQVLETKLVTSAGQWRLIKTRDGLQGWVFVKPDEG